MYAEAVRKFQEYVDETSDPKGYQKLALAQAHLRNFSEASNNIGKALELAPDEVDVLNTSAYIKAQRGMIEGALRDWRRVLEIDPKNRIASENLARFGERKEKTETSSGEAPVSPVLDLIPHRRRGASPWGRLIPALLFLLLSIAAVLAAKFFLSSQPSRIVEDVASRNVRLPSSISSSSEPRNFEGGGAFTEISIPLPPPSETSAGDTPSSISPITLIPFDDRSIYDSGPEAIAGLLLSLKYNPDGDVANYLIEKIEGLSLGFEDVSGDLESSSGRVVTWSGRFVGRGLRYETSVGGALSTYDFLVDGQPQRRVKVGIVNSMGWVPAEARISGIVTGSMEDGVLRVLLVELEGPEESKVGTSAPVYEGLKRLGDIELLYNALRASSPTAFDRYVLSWHWEAIRGMGRNKAENIRLISEPSVDALLKGFSLYLAGERLSASDELRKAVEAEDSLGLGHYLLEVMGGAWGDGKDRSRNLPLLPGIIQGKTSEYLVSPQHLLPPSEVHRPHQEASKSYGEGWRRLRAGDSAGAAEAFGRAAELDPQYAPALYGLGWVSLSEGDLEGARGNFSKALEVDPDFEPAKMALSRLGEWKSPPPAGPSGGVEGPHPDSPGSAEPSPEETLPPRAAEETPRAYYDLGWELLREGKTDRAEMAFKHILDLDPNYLQAHYGLGWVDMRNGNYERAILRFKKVLSMNEEFTPARKALDRAIDAFEIQKEILADRRRKSKSQTAPEGGPKGPEKGISEYRALLSQNPDLVEIRCRLAELLIEAGDYDGAQIELGRLSSSGDPVARRRADRLFALLEIKRGRIEISDVGYYEAVSIPERYVGKVVRWRGRVENPRIRNGQTRFVLVIEGGGKREVAYITFEGEFPLKGGEAVEVIGKFRGVSGFGRDPQIESIQLSEI
ncbi:MAG: tetratricopeptide repeat protein [bacterium]